MEKTSNFPEHSGTEEETRATLVQYDKDSGQMTRTRALTSKELSRVNTMINPYCPALPGCNTTGDNYFRENGSRTYVDVGGVELASPEVSNPADQAIYIKADAQLYERALADFTTEEAKRVHAPVATFFQRRVIDQEGNTWGCHDNYSIRDDIDYGNLVANEDMPTSQLWLGFLMSRVITTGALYIGSEGAYFSQKLSQPHVLFNSYGYLNSMLRVDREHGQRLEIRCSDINIQDWATVARVGGAALLLAATQTPLAQKLLDSPHYDVEWPRFDDWNNVPLDDDLKFVPNDKIMAHIAAQKFTFETILGEYEKFAGRPIPKTYRQIGRSILKFCADLEAVLSGQAEIDLLADRCDWASKLYVVRRDIARNEDRALGDDRSKYLDMLYDQIKISAAPKEKAKVELGYGHKLAAKHSFYRNRTSLLETATIAPPAKSRAAARVKIAKKMGENAKSCNWDYVRVETGDNRSKSIQLNASMAD